MTAQGRKLISDLGETFWLLRGVMVGAGIMLARAIHTHLIRGVNYAMSRHIIGEMDKVGIGIDSATCDIVGFPPGRGAAGSSARLKQLMMAARTIKR